MIPWQRDPSKRMPAALSSNQRIQIIFFIAVALIGTAVVVVSVLPDPGGASAPGPILVHFVRPRRCARLATKLPHLGDPRPGPGQGSTLCCYVFDIIQNFYDAAP